MDSRRSPGYGAFDGNQSAAGRFHSRALYQGDDLSNEFLVLGTIDEEDAKPSRHASPSSRGWSSWWRVGLAVAASATAFSAAMGIVNYSSFSGTEQPLAGPSPPDFAKTKANSGKVAARKEDKAAPVTHGGATDKGFDSAVRATEKEQHKGPEALAFGHHAESKEGGQQKSPVVELDGEPNGDLTFTAMNDYNRRGDIIGRGYAWLEGHHLVEPHRVTTLAIELPVEGRVYTWDIVETRNVAKAIGQFEGASVEVTFESAPEYTVILLEKRADGTVSRSLTKNVYCKYVRREIRSLFDDERNEMFDAMKVS